MIANQEVIDSYKNSFKSPLGAYVYMMLNQNVPEMFVLSSKKNDDITLKLEEILLNTTNIENLNNELKQLPENLFQDLELLKSENDLSKKKLLQLVGNLKYLSIDLVSNNAWQELNGFIDYNGYSNYVSNKLPLQKKLKECAEKFSFASLSVNPNFKPDDFLNNLEIGINAMCETLNILPKQIGLNVLNVNYKSEEGDFTGYVHYDSKNTPGNNISYNKMVINKIEVFAHEWMHFIEISLGSFKYALTDIIDESSLSEYKTLFSDYDKVFNFKEIVNTKDIVYNENTLASAVQSAAHFFERYAIAPDKFYANIHKIATEFEENYKQGINKDNCLEIFENSISNLLQTPHPTRYFSFLKAQCDLYVNQVDKKTLKTNQFVDFSQKSDEYLKSKNYTESIVEVFARSFETFLYEKISIKDKKCPLLASSYNSDFYPQANMKQKLNDFWENSWPQIKKGIDNVMPIAVPKKMKGFMAENIMELRHKYHVGQSSELKSSNTIR